MGREILGLAGDSLFIEKLNLACKKADAVLQKKVFHHPEGYSSNGRSIGSTVDDLFLELAPEMSKFNSSPFPSMNTEPVQEFSWEYFHMDISDPNV